MAPNTNIISRAMEGFFVLFCFYKVLKNGEKVQMLDCLDPRLEIIF